MQTELTASPRATPATSMPWHAIIAGMCANLVGIGLARFAYTPLIPSLIQAHWFATSDIVYLSAANLAGYFVGALVGRPIARQLSNRNTLRLMMLMVTLSFAACALPLSFSWFFGWRLVSGVAGGAIMVVVASTVLPHIPSARKGFATGAIFLGLGLGIAASGTLIPILLEQGLRQTWIGLSVFSALLTAISWLGWPAALPVSVTAQAPVPASHRAKGHSLLLKSIYVQFGFMAVALVPLMVFLVDFVARGLGKGAHIGALYWILYGVGALIGPILYSALADYLGPVRGIRWVLLVQAAVVATLYTSHNAILIGALTVVIGTFPPGIVPLMMARIHQLLPNDPLAQGAAWTRATTAFALFQALSGYGYSMLFNASGGNHRLLFLISVGALGVAMLIEVLVLGYFRVLERRERT
ncbi:MULTISPECIES: YbfB/YjiJ family MFS transporter [unclassified Pseudomonas]|uniref:YbfB/YjiJ family MFS transporter n=1 Tax=unclassified Pseudomonas TaxID=196821 RepID=UPI002AC8BBD5|nr:MULTISPECIES: YbfB/YjiJ family MFS transporter [unclassified Pseudomonas]MEB0043545.1 YbfB/YjiJ family MFS transporter [Pseudomonas sp. MH10]MEB0079965.1 YbfB/YjiJ family MFS transporter [Pseudomonas sp. MH10out]MEB0093982.1 YbfB/YjiJ family MFS transporter [Pseudomonas sp. CCI4.2]MEB0102441.1 YbfB/YjiJ family MFS transporter [Pseudomonas sp. CCI3.2]MEB0123326.1 YbfB/YjiJ family MFS transporter [Pseudomonas sp. CCI1.2]